MRGRELDSERVDGAGCVWVCALVTQNTLHGMVVYSYFLAGLLGVAMAVKLQLLLMELDRKRPEKEVAYEAHINISFGSSGDADYWLRQSSIVGGISSAGR